MSVLSELEKRLTENEERIGILIQNLEAHADLEESLRNTGNGLDEVIEQVRQLAESTKVTIQSLADILVAFQETVEILRRSDPARATKAVERVEERLKGMEQGITKTIRAPVERVEERLIGVEQGITKTIGETVEEISSTQKEVERKLEAEGKSIRESMPNTIVYTTLAFVLVLLVLEIYTLSQPG